MNFKSAAIKLGVGCAGHAEADGENAVALIYKSDGISEITVNLSTRAVSDCGVVSLADECLPVKSGRWELLGELYYVEDV